MKSRFTRTTILWVGLLMVALLLASCAPSQPPLPAPLPAGQIKGTLVANGEPIAGTLLYIAIAPQDGAGSVWVQMHDATADGDGNFIYENMEPGKYMLMLGEKGPSGLSIKYVMKDGDRFTFELPEGSGVDLGEVDASVTLRFQ
jgi:hypothetical protein